jgi:Tetratricopeptide repeat
MNRVADGGPILELEIEAQPSGVPTGAASLAALAEQQRRAGDPEAALRSAREASALDPGSPAARAASALALLDLGRDTEARRQLAALIHGVYEHETSAFDVGGIEDGELERAFEDASPEPEAMHDANEVAFEAMREAELLGPEADPAALGSPFRTRTMASLLESQGDRNAARAIRASLAPRNEAPRNGRRQDDVIRTLERWLGRLRRGDA